MANVDVTVRMIDKVSATSKNVTASLKNIASGAVPLSAGMERAGDAVTNFAMANKTTLIVLGALALALRKAVNDTVEYNSAIHDLSLMSGESMESSSRLAQVLDDFKISTEQLTPIIRAMTNQGLAPNIETMARLSDEYKAIQDPVEKNAFLFRNFGRAGDELVLTMNAGGDALRNMSAEVGDSLIATEQGFQASEKYRLAVDDLSDSWQGVTHSIGNVAIPVLTDVLKIIDIDIQAVMTLNKALSGDIKINDWAANLINSNLPSFLEKTAKDMTIQEKAARGAAAGNKELGASALQTAEELKAEAEAAQLVTEANQSLLSLTMSLQSETDNYSESMADATAKQQELGQAIQEASAKFGEASPQVAELQEKYIEAGGAIDELKAKHADAMNAIVYGLITAKLQADGFTDAEFQMAIAAGVALGQVDQQTADLAVSINDLTNQALASNDVSILANGIESLTGLSSAAAASGKSLDEMRTEAASTGGAMTDAQAKTDALTQAVTTTGDTGTAKMKDLQRAFDTLNTDKAVGQINKVTAALNNIPTEIEVTITQTTVTNGAATGYADGTRGKWETVPSGYPNDTYPIALTSGEKFMVMKPNESPSQAAGSEGTITAGGNQIINIFAPVTLQIENADAFAGR